MIAAIQTVGEGGETNLHSHKNLDGFWFVLSGQSRFYTTDDVVIADLGPMEGILIPRGYPYWFEKSGDDELMILQVEASAKLVKSLTEFKGDRTNYAPHREDVREVHDHSGA
ncbi:MAG TPA: cupin domain-containing protein [Acidimicrobiales bacterium]|nr:cupin domain-containing protein [Acidimicrobiales bacterium]